MRRIVKATVFAALIVLSMGGTCRQETAESVINAFLIEIAETTGEAIGETLVDRTTP
jgi:hypothetical protein